MLEGLRASRDFHLFDSNPNSSAPLERDLTENTAVEVVAGLGVGDDSVDGIKVEVDRYVGLVVNPNMDINEQFNILWTWVT